MNNDELNKKKAREIYLSKRLKSVDELLIKNLQKIEDMRNRDEDITGITSGFPSLDRVTYGWQPTDLIILAARPSVGKTAFALNVACSAALHPTKPTAVAFFSLEMSAVQLVQRILSAESEIWLDKINRGKLEEHEMKQLYKKGIERLSSAPIFIDDSAALTIKELSEKFHKLKEENNVGLFIVDYLQLMSGEKENFSREQEISLITRELKSLAKQLEVSIIALSQLTRDVERRKEGAKIPQLSDLRDSGSIEQDADMVMFLYRPEYYDITANEMGESNKGETYVKIAKHRNGSLDTIKLKALLHIQKFVEDENGEDFGNFKSDGNFKPLKDDGGVGLGKLYIQRPTKMNDSNFYDEPPF